MNRTLTLRIVMAGAVIAFMACCPASAQDYVVANPPDELQLPQFYKKYVSASGYPVVSSANVNDYALKEAAYIVDMMLAKRPDIRRAMIASGSRLIVMAHSEFTTDIPEYAHLHPKDYWDARARGLGGSLDEPVCSCAEENMLAFEGDPYSTENILIHEFAHNIHYRGMINLDPDFDKRLRRDLRARDLSGTMERKVCVGEPRRVLCRGRAVLVQQQSAAGSRSQPCRYTI